MEANPSRRMSQTARCDPRRARRVPLHRAPRRAAERRIKRPGTSARLRGAGRSTRDLRRGAAGIERAGDISLRGSGPLLVFDSADVEPARRGSGEVTAGRHTKWMPKLSRCCVEDAGTKGGFHRVFAAPDDPITIDEATALSLVILRPGRRRIPGKGTAKSDGNGRVDGRPDAMPSVPATFPQYVAVRRAPTRRYLGTAREVTAKAMAWASIVSDDRLQQQITQAQATDAKEKAKTHADGALRAVRAAWSHILYPVKSETAGKPFDLEHSLISARERSAIPVVVYQKISGDGIAIEKLGSERLWHALGPIWPEDRPHLGVSEVAGWFATYVYLPKVRDRVVLETSIRDAVAKLDPLFGYADGYDEVNGQYTKLVWAKNVPEVLPSGAVIVRASAAKAQVAATERRTPPTNVPEASKTISRPGQGRIRRNRSLKVHVSRVASMVRSRSTWFVR